MVSLITFVKCTTSQLSSSNNYFPSFYPIRWRPVIRTMPQLDGSNFSKPFHKLALSEAIGNHLSVNCAWLSHNLTVSGGSVTKYQRSILANFDLPFVCIVKFHTLGNCLCFHLLKQKGRFQWISWHIASLPAPWKLMLLFCSFHFP